MWTSLSATATVLWDDCLWWLAATWQDDAESEPVVLHKSGRTCLNGADDPALILGRVLQALEASLVAGGSASATENR